jgi:Redoxin
MKLLFALATATTLLACAPARAPVVSRVTLHATDGAAIPLDAALREHRLTVVTFFSAHCPCQRAHDVRLRELIAAESPRGVGFLVVDSERTASVADDSREAASRGYPIMLDDGGSLARALDAEYSTYSVILDPAGNVVYRGGFDSDKTHLRDDRKAYLSDALDDALSGRPIARAEAKALGCTLELR